MTITISIASVVTIASAIVAVGGAVTVLNGAKKKLEAPIKDINQKLDKDKKRLDRLDDIADGLKRDNELTLMALKSIINHLRTSNNTGKMEELEKDIDSYLIKR